MRTLTNRQGPGVFSRSVAEVRAMHLVYLRKLGRQVVKEVLSWGKDQIMPTVIALLAAWASIFFGLLPRYEGPAAYITVLASFGCAALVYLIAQVVRAPFAIHREQQEQIAQLHVELEQAKGAAANEQSGLGEALREHTRELQTERLWRAAQRAATIPSGPEAMIAIQTGNEPRIVVTNQGAAADFWGVFTASGLVSSKSSAQLSCRWEHTSSPKARIAKGETRRIELAELVWTPPPLPSCKWTIKTSSESGPVDVQAIYSSTAVTKPISRAPDVVLTGFIYADPDLLNGRQPFTLILSAFGSKVPESGDV